VSYGIVAPIVIFQQCTERVDVAVRFSAMGDKKGGVTGVNNQLFTDLQLRRIFNEKPTVKEFDK